MQAQVIAHQQIQNIFSLYNPHPSLFVSLDKCLMKETQAKIDSYKQILTELEALPLVLINFHSFCKIIRLIKRRAIPFKSQQIENRLANYILKFAKLYFPYPNTILNNPNFDEYLKLFSGLRVKVGENWSDQRETILILSQNNYSKQWSDNLVQKINNEVLVDKKNQQIKFLKVNKYFNKFLVDNFDRLLPQLERLLVRSQSNIDIWQQFFTSVDDWTGIDRYVLPLLSKIKHLFVNNPQISIKIVVAVTKNLSEQKSTREVGAFLSGLISSEQNVKRKIIYLRMLRGVIQSLTKHKDVKLKNECSQDIILVLTNSLVKFTQQQDFNLLIDILDKILPLVSQPRDDIAKAARIYLKNTNKYIFILFSAIIATIYRKQHVQKYNFVKEIFNHYKTQLNAIIKNNWQSSLPVIHFLSNIDLQYADNISYSSPLFKVSCLALSKLEKKIAFNLILKHIELSKQSEDEQIQDNVYAILVLLSEEIKQRRQWQQLINKLTVEERIKLVSRGIYPLILFPCSELKINKGNNFTSLLLFIYKSVCNEDILINSGVDLISTVIAYSKLRPNLKERLNTQQKDIVVSQIQRYVNSSLYNYDNEQQNICSERERNQIEQLSNQILIYQQQYLIKLLQSFTKQHYYQNDLHFLNSFQLQALDSLKNVKKQLNQIRNQLVQRSIHKYEEPKPKKVYIGVIYEVKMMSEQEVKEEKYRKHFQKMLVIFDKIVSKLLKTLNSHHLVNQLWQINLKSILAVTKFAEHRLSIQKLVKRSCLFSAWHNKQIRQSRIFSKHAQFLGEFFAFRHSKITPSIKTMGHCEQFLKQLLVIPFQTQQNFEMLQSTDNQFVMLFVNEMCEYLLQNMEFDVNLKRHAIVFYHKCLSKNIDFKNHDVLFTYIAHNINILGTAEHIQSVLLHLLKKVDKSRIRQLFSDILNYIQSTKKLILRTLLLLDYKYKPQFEQFIKLRILALQSNQQISHLSNQILSEQKQLKNSILTFNMKNFVKMNSKETIQKLCIFIKEQITPATCEDIFYMVIKASQQLFDQGFDQEGLEMFPFFLTINIDYISQRLYKPIFELLILKFTAKEDFGTLTKLSVQIGISIIKKYADLHAEKLLLVLQNYINKATGVSNIIYLGVLAPYLQGNKNLQIIEKRITELFKSNKQAQQKAISKCMPDLMSFFKLPLEIVDYIFNNISTMGSETLQIGQAYLFSGLLKGIGYRQTQNYLDKILSSNYIAKTKPEKSGRIHLLNALVQNFGRVVQLKGVKIMSIMISYMADNAQEIRNISKKVGQTLIIKMSSYSVKSLLPELLKGLQEQQNWRVKISYIWILGIMANCSAKQLQTSLPIIVPTLSTCLSNAHPTIREKASEALNLIGQTIKNPQISQCVDILIQALENPFENSERALEILLKTSFSHYIDPPSLSMIIPILDYCMRGRSSDLKAGSCQVIGSIVQLISNPFDLLPYLKIIITGLRVALCDPLPEIRCIAAMAIGRIAAKIGVKQAQVYFKFVLDIIESPTSNTTERQGAAQAYAEIVCSQNYEYFQESLYKIFEKLNSVRHSQKQGYILVFLYVPSIRTQQFEGFIKEVNENMYCFVSDEQQNIRNSAMLVEKVLINNYCLTHTDLLLGPLCDGVFENNWKKRNSALILIGEMLNIIKNHMYVTRDNEKSYAYYRGLMAVYIIKDDELEMPRLTANQVWNTYIQNTPKTIKLGLSELSKMWTKWTHSANGVVFKNIVAFSSKYGQNYFPEILQHLEALLKEQDHQVGVFEVLSEFIKRLNMQYLSKEGFKESIRSIFADNLYTIPETVRPSLAKSLALYIDKMHEQKFFEDLLYSTIDKMDTTDESNLEYTKNLHLLKDLLQTNSNKVVDRVINKIMEAPMSQFKIEVITNNSERLANYLYSHFKVPATQLFIDEIYTLVGSKSKQNRLSLIIYCLEQVSLQLNKKNKTQFIKMINNNIYKGINNYSENRSDEKRRKILEIFINMLLFFLNSSQISEMQDLETIIGQLSPLIFFQNETLKSLGHRIYLLLISDNKNANTSTYIRQMVVSLENNLTKQDQIIWDNEVTFKDYVNMLVKGIAYGKEQIMQQSLEMFEFIMKHTTRSIIEKEILRIVGPIIRISNYPLLQKQKIKIMSVLINILKESFKIDAYNNQILSICLRLLQEFKSSEQVMKTVADTYFALLIGTSLKQDLILSILGKIKSFGANLVRSFYYLIKQIVLQRVQLPKSLLDKIYQDCMIILLTNQGKLPVKGLYYASKIAARLAVLLGRPIQKAEANLKAVICSYQNVINYLHFAYYKKVVIKRHEAIQIFLKESNRQKAHYLLKSLKLCLKNSDQCRKIYSLQYIRDKVPESIIGFEDIGELLEYFESEKPLQIVVAEINLS